MSFGQWLVQKRKAAGLTQKELADYAGISPNYISALERDEPNAKDGSPRRPRIDKVDKLARPLRVTTDEIRVAAGYAPVNSAGFIFRMANATDEKAIAELWNALAPDQQDAVKELVIATIRSLATVSQEIIGKPIAPTAKTKILKAKTYTQDKRKAQ